MNNRNIHLLIRDVLPRLTFFDVLYGSSAHAKPHPNSSHSDTLPQKSADLGNIGLPQFRAPLFLATGHPFGILTGAAAVACCRAPLANHVEVVIGVSAEEQVVGVDTRRVVAVMANKQPIGDRPDKRFVSEPMSTLDRANHTVGCAPTPRELPVAFWPNGSLPQPTGVCLLHGAHKAHYGVFEASCVPVEELPGPPLDIAQCYVRSLVEWRRIATAARAKAIVVKGQLDGGIGRWYTRHVSASNTGTSHSPAVRAARGLLVPNYSTSVRGGLV